MKFSNETTFEIALLEYQHSRSANVSCNRMRPFLRPQPTPNPLARARLRDLRAAEMNAWLSSGGDYLRSARRQPDLKTQNSEL